MLTVCIITIVVLIIAICILAVWVHSLTDAVDTVKQQMSKQIGINEGIAKVLELCDSCTKN